MGGYENLAVRDAAGNIVGYRSTTGGSDFVPSANYIALQQQYRIQQGATVGSGPTTYAPVSAPINYNDNSAAGIAAMITARGGVVDPYLSQNALQQGFITPQANIGSPADARSTVPIWDLSYEATKGTLVPGATHATYPVGNEGGVTLIPGRTWLNTVTGESITENIPYGHSIYNIAGGGGAYSAQSGTTWAGSDLNKIPSAVVRTQDYGRYAPSDTRGVNTQLSVPDYATILANPKSYSRGGSEAYNFQAGVPLQAGRVLQTQETAAPTYGSKDWYSQRIAWGDRVATANTEGNPQKYPEVFAGSFATPTTQRLVEGVVTSEPGSGRRAPAGSGMLVNYITPAGMQYKKGDDTSLSAQNVDMIDYGYKYTNPLSTPDRRSAAGGYVATPEPKEIWGRTTTLVPPTQESGNRFGDLQTTMGYVPNPKYVAPVEAIATKAAMPTVYGEAARQVVTANYKDIDTSLLRKPIENISTIPVETAMNAGAITNLTGRITPVPLYAGWKSVALPLSPQTTVTKTMSGGNQTISNMGVWLTTSKAQLELEESSLDTTNAGAVSAYNLKVGEYMAKRDVFMAMQKENPVIETTTTTTTTTGETKPQSNGLPTGVYFTGEITPMKNINQEPSLIEKGQRVLGGIGGFFRSVGEVPYVGNVVDIVSNSPIASKLIPGFSLGADLTVKSPYTQATPEMPYGEYSQWSTSASDFFSRQLKNTPEAMLQQSEEAKQGAATAWTKGDIAGAVVKGFDTFRYGAASSVWQNPGQIPTAIVQGKVIGAGMEMYSGAVTPVITKVGNAGVVRQAAGWALQHAPEVGFVAMMAGELTRGEPIKTYGAAGNIVSEKQAPWFSTASGAQISQNVGKMAPAIVAMFGSGAVYDTIAGEKVTTTSSFIRTDPTMVASGGLFETTGKITPITEQVPPTQYVNFEVRGVDPTQIASGGLLRSTPYKGEVISESTTSRVGGIFGEGGLYPRAKPVVINSVVEIANFNPAGYEIQTRPPTSTTVYPDRMVTNAEGMRVSNPKWEAIYSEEYGILGGQGLYGKMTAAKLVKVKQPESNPQPPRNSYAWEDWKAFTTKPIAETPYPSGRTPGKVSLFEAVSMISLGTSSSGTYGGSFAIQRPVDVSIPGGLYGSVGVPEIMTRFGGGYDSLGAPSGLTAKARALPEPMPIEYSGIGMSNFYGRPVKADMAITQSAEIPYRGAIAVPQPQYGYTTPMAEMGSISDTSSKSLVSTKTIYTPISEMGTIALISSRSDVAARSRSAATDLTNTYPGTSSKSESGVMAGIQTGSASKSSVESMSAISSGLVGSMSFSASSPISRSFDTVMPVSTPRSDVTAEDISFPYTSTISQVTTTPGTIPDTITTVAPPYQIVPPPIIPIIPILPSFPGVPSTPTGTPAKRRRAFTEFLPIGEGVGWINLLGTPTRQPAIMPSRKAAPAPTMRIAVPKSTSTVRIPKRGTPAKQKPLGGFSINIPKAKKGRVRRIS